jgi:hypothetical protein
MDSSVTWRTHVTELSIKREMLRAEIVLLEDDGLYCVGAKGAEGRTRDWAAPETFSKLCARDSQDPSLSRLHPRISSPDKREMLRAEIVLLEDDGLYCVGAKGAEGRELYWRKPYGVLSPIQLSPFCSFGPYTVESIIFQ